MNDNNYIIQIKNLCVSYLTEKNLFSLKSDKIVAVNDISLDITKGTTTGLVGESGCGKSTIAKAMLRLFNKGLNDVEIKGDINLLFEENPINILKLSKKEMRKLRKHIQIIFQDPSSSLNPRFPVGKIIEEPLIYNTSLVKKERIERVLFLLEKVGISTDKYSSYPYEFSGGQKQRISIARALASGPELIICDEPVSSLDVSIQAQIINLLMDLQKDFNLSILFISHDISVVKQISRNILVMYMGKIIESGEASKIYFNSVHPYTKLLICSIPGYISKNDTVIPLIENSENIHRHSSCSFVSRCSLAQNICNENEPRLEKIAENHYAACFFCRK